MTERDLIYAGWALWDELAPVVVTIGQPYFSNGIRVRPSKIENFTGSLAGMAALLDHAERQSRRVVIYRGVNFIK